MKTAIFFAVGAVSALIVAVTAFALRQTALRIDALNSQSAFAMTRHGGVEYAVWGAGPPVLALHGAGGGFDQGKLLAEAVGGEQFQFISVSRFGYLRSALPESPTIEAQAETLSDLLDSLNIDRVNILAMSGGAPPALKFAEMFPERTGRIVLLSAAPFTPFSPVIEKRPLPTWAYGALLGNDVVYWTLTKIARNALRDAFDARAELRREMSESERVFVESLIDGFLPASKRLKGLTNEIAAVDPKAKYDLECVAAPALIFHAKDDRMNPVAISASIARYLPNSDYVEFETGGHLLLGRHDEIRDRLRIFLME